MGVAEGERREELGELGLSEGHLLHVVRRLIVCLQQTITSRNCHQVYLIGWLLLQGATEFVDIDYDLTKHVDDGEEERHALLLLIEQRCHVTHE